MKNAITVVAMMSFVGVFAGSASANDAQREMEALLKPADKALVELANKGDADAQYRLSKNFLARGNFMADSTLNWFNGKGISSWTNDFARQCFDFAKRSADQGNADGMNMLGICHGFGISVEPSIEKAREWFTKASVKGSEKAKINLELSCDEDLELYYAKQIFGSISNTGKSSEGKYRPSSVEEALGVAYRCCKAKGKAQEAALRFAFHIYDELKDSDNGIVWFELGRSYWFGTGVEENHKEAVKWLDKSWSHGIVAAASLLGEAYEKGLGVEKNSQKALELYKALAKDGGLKSVPLTAYKIACIYDTGDGVAKNMDEAIKWYTAGAEAGDTRCMGRLGYLYEFGKDGVKKDTAKALDYYLQGAKGGATNLWLDAGLLISITDPDAAGDCYKKALSVGNVMAEVAYGRICLQEGSRHYNPVEAVKWLTKGYEQGMKFAARDLGCAYLYGSGVERNVSKALDFFEESASNGDAKSLWILADIFYQGIYIDRDLKLSKVYLDRAAQSGYKLAQEQLKDKKRWNNPEYVNAIDLFDSEKGYSIGEEEAKRMLKVYKDGAAAGIPANIYDVGILYWYGIGFQKDLDKAYEYISSAADKGYDKAYNSLGIWHMMGIGGTTNGVEALKWFQKAAKAGNFQAEHNIGCLYDFGVKGIAKDPATAFKWYMISAEHGNPKAQTDVGVCYLEGFGTAVNAEEAVKWLEKAARQGDVKAIRILQLCEAEGVGETAF